MIFNLSVIDRAFAHGTGYIAGTGDGIVTVAGKAASRAIYLYTLYSHKPMVLVTKTWSTDKGNYIFPNIDIKMRYLVMVRDCDGSYEPFAYDYVEPAIDLTVHEQYQLQQLLL